VTRDIREKLIASKILLPSAKINPNWKIILGSDPEITKFILETAPSYPEMRDKIKCLSLGIRDLVKCETCQRIINPTKKHCDKKCAANDVAVKLNVFRSYQKSILKKYGVKNLFQSDVIKAKIRKTNLSRRGVENPFQCSAVKAKIAETNTKKYGCRSATSSDVTRQKTKNTNLARYGVEHPMKSDEVKLNLRNSLVRSYGVEYPGQIGVSFDSIRKIKDETWLRSKYLAENLDIIEIAKELNVSAHTIFKALRRAGIKTKKIRGFSKKAIRWMDEIAESQNLKIRHALNGGEFTIPGTKIRVDGYCEETNTIYEFHGDAWHGNLKIFKPTDKPNPFKPNVTAEKLYFDTINRDEQIKKLGYDLVSIWETS